MSGEKDLNALLSSLDPVLANQSYAFCTYNGKVQDIVEYNPFAFVCEEEGITLIVEEEKAKEKYLIYEGPFGCITLNVHSSLYAVGLTAIITTELAKHNISVNVIAGYYHDHVFVEEDKAEEALGILKSLRGRS